MKFIGVLFFVWASSSALAQESIEVSAHWQFATALDISQVTVDDRHEYGYGAFHLLAGRDLFAALWRPGIFTLTGEVEANHSDGDSMGLELHGIALQNLTRRFSVAGLSLLMMKDYSFIDEEDPQHGRRKVVPALEVDFIYRWFEALSTRLEVCRSIGVSENNLFATAVVAVDVGAGFRSELAYAVDVLDNAEESGRLRFAYAF